jgi:hypothetical protein
MRSLEKVPVPEPLETRDEALEALRSRTARRSATGPTLPSFAGASDLGRTWTPPGSLGN